MRTHTIRMLSGFLVAIRWPNVRGGMIYVMLALTLATRLVFSQTGVGDRLDWTVHWTDLLAGALAPALLLHLAIVLSRRTLSIPGRWVAVGYAVACESNGPSIAVTAGFRANGRYTDERISEA